MKGNENIILSIDVAHPPRKPDIVEQQIDEALIKIKNNSSYRILKIIHGKSGNTKVTVRNWAYRSAKIFKFIIHGEDYDLFNQLTLEMRRECGPFTDIDLGKANGGITIVWVE